MTEKERYIPKWEKGKIIGAKDTELHLTLNVKIMIRELNGQNQRIKELEEENKQLKIEVLGQSEEIEILSGENKRLKQGKYIYGIHGGSNDRK